MNHLDKSKEELFRELEELRKVFKVLYEKKANEEKQYDKELVKSELLYRSLTENSPDLIARYDRQCRHLYLNPIAVKVGRYSLEKEYLGKTIREVFIPEKGAAIWEKHVQTVFETGESSEIDDCFQTPAGLRYLNSKFVPERDTSDNILSVLSISRDITDRKETEFLIKEKNEEYEALNEELRQTNEELSVAKEKAEESDLLKSTFLQNISHEVRTPLNAIVGFSELMLSPNQTPEKLKIFSEAISNNSDKLIQIITDVIEISQIHSNQVSSTLADIDIITLINKTVNRFSEKARAKRIDLVSNLKIPTEEYFILSDKNKLESIFSHIIDNAIKFTHQGRVEITTTIDKEMLNISISDTGIGISEQMQKAIFEPFRQVEVGTRRDYGGNGLGLSLAKSYVELLNGSLRLTSEIGKGTTFSISIPTVSVAKQTEQKLISKQPNSIKTILIAEDEYSNYLYLLELLEDNATKILYAENGQQAVELCRENKNIDLILMDIKMPIMDGHDAALQIKKLRPELPIIAQTAYALDAEKEAFISTFDDYIAKPIKGKELKQKLSKYFIIKH